MEKVCKGCGQPLAVVLAEEQLDWHIICAPEGEFQAWLEKHPEYRGRGPGDKV